MLKINDLYKSYFTLNKELPILKGLKLDVQKGEKVAIIGPSGSGKSTLLSLLAGLDKPDKGQIIINTTNIVDLDESRMTHFRSQHIGIVFQQFHLVSQLTAIENVQLPLDLSQDPQSYEKALEALKSVNLENRADHFPHQLSGGERQRVAIARSFVVEPDILLADEPSGSLDSKSGELIMDKLFDLVQKNQMTLILVTHNLDLAKRCDHTYQLHEGHLV